MISQAGRLFATLLLIGAFAVFGMTSPAAAQPSASETANASADHHPDVIAVYLYADWCGTCQELSPKKKAVKSDFSGEPILFTTLDFTDDFTSEQAERFVEWTGLEGVLDEHEGRTGYVILLNAETHEEIGRLTHDQSEDDLRQTISDALAAAQ